MMLALLLTLQDFPLTLTLPYHTDLMHWMAESLWNLCQIHGVLLPPRLIFPGTTIAASTKELPKDDDPLDDDGVVPDDTAPIND